MIYLKSIFYFILAGLFEIGGRLSCLVVDQREQRLDVRAIRSHSFSSVRIYSNFATGSFWPCVCCLWRSIYHLIVNLGLEDRRD